MTMWEKLKKTAFIQGCIKLKNDLKPMTFKEKCEHLWEYYKEWLLVVFLVIMGISLLTTIIANRSKDVLVSGMVVNVSMDPRGMTYLTTDYAKVLGATSKNQVCEVDATGFGDPLDPENGENSYYSSMILPARVTGAMLDYMLLDEFAMKYYITHDVYMDLRNFFTEEELEELAAADKLIYAMEEGDIDRMPIAVKITDLAFVKDNTGNTGEVFFALSGSSPRPEMCRHVWNYLHAWQTPAE